MRTAAAQIDPNLKVEQPNLPFESKEVQEKAFERPEEEEEVVVAKKEKEEEPDASAVLLKQIDELRKSERLAKEEIERIQQESAAERQRYEGDLSRSRQTAEQAQLEVIETAMTAAQSDAENAQRDLELAIQSADAKAQAEAQRRLAKAEAYIGRLEDGKLDLEGQMQANKVKAERQEQVRKNDPIESLSVPPPAKQWLRSHPEYATDQRKNVKLQAAHWDALDEGHAPFSTGYFESVEKILGLQKDETPIEEQEVERPHTSESRKAPLVSAPVSREVPSGGKPRSQKQVRLTEAEVDAARASGITEAEYARQKVKLQEAKANGSYGEHR